MNTCVINRTIECIPDLNHIAEGLLEKFQEKYEHTCSKHHGYILKVLRILKITTCKISIYNGYALVQCDIEVECLLPKVGSTVQGVIKQVYPQGIITTVHDCMKVFIPVQQTMENIKHTLDMTITQVRFQKGKYDCIANIASF